MRSSQESRKRSTRELRYYRLKVGMEKHTLLSIRRGDACCAVFPSGRNRFRTLIFQIDLYKR